MPTFQIDCLLEYQVHEPTEFIFQVEASKHAWQNILHEEIVISSMSKAMSEMPAIAVKHFDRDQGVNRFARLSAPAEQAFRLHYQARVETSIPTRPIDAEENAIHLLPSETFYYLAPSRFCESDLLERMAQRTFGHIPTGYQRVQTICDWIYAHIIYESGSSDHTTSAKDILVSRAGVCRDFAHLAIAICRALDIPARFVFGYMPFYQAMPDFHAIFEVYLGQQWVLFDATKMGPIEEFVRVGTGLDAKDVPFASFFGQAELLKIQPQIHKLEA